MDINTHSLDGEHDCGEKLDHTLEWVVMEQIQIETGVTSGEVLLKLHLILILSTIQLFNFLI